MASKSGNKKPSIKSRRTEGQKRYDKYLEVYRKAHPELKSITQYDCANEEWTNLNLKNDENMRNQRMAELNVKAQNSTLSLSL